MTLVNIYFFLYNSNTFYLDHSYYLNDIVLNFNALFQSATVSNCNTAEFN